MKDNIFSKDRFKQKSKWPEPSFEGGTSSLTAMTIGVMTGTQNI